MPEQLVLAVFVVIDVESINSEKFTVMFDPILIDPAELVGEVEMTVGAVESITVVFAETVKGVTESVSPLTPVLLVTYNVQSL